MKMLAKMKADTDEDLVLLLLAAFRALGWKSRLVINFVILPLKPPKDYGAVPAKSSDKKTDDIKTHEPDTKPSTTNNVQGKKKCSSGSSMTEGADPKPGTSRNDKTKKKSSRKSSSKSKSDRESFVIDQLDGSNDIENGSSVRRSSKSRAPREKDRSKRKVRIQDDGEDFSPPKKTRPSSPHSSSKRGSSREGNNNKTEDFKSSSDAKNTRSTNGQKSRRCSKSSPSKLSSGALAEAARRSSTRPRSARAKVDLKGSESEEDFDSMVEAPTKRRKSASARAKTLKDSESDEDFDSMVEAPTKRRKAAAAVKTKNSAKAAKKAAIPANGTKMTDYFLEVLVKGEWVCVDAMRARTDCAEEMEAKASKPMLYVLACNADSTVKDVTMRYAKNYMTDARKKRMDQVSPVGFILSAFPFLKFSI